MTKKSELRLDPHRVLNDALVIEVWHDGEFIAAVYGADGPGVRVVSKHRLHADATSVGAITVRVGQ